jgi:UDP-glucose 4-epimerase
VALPFPDHIPGVLSTLSTAPDLAGDRFLVTGADGFVGVPFCRRLATLGGEVHAVAPRARPDEGGVHWHGADLERPGTGRELMASVRPDVLFHLVSQVAEAPGLEGVLPSFHSGLASTVYLLAAAAELGCRRFVQVGSQEEPEPGEPQVVPASPQAAARWAAAAYARMFFRLYETPVVRVRLFTVYGPGQEDYDELVPGLIRALLAGEEPSVPAGGRPVDWVYLDDVVDGLVAASRVSGLEGRRLDLGSGKLVPVRTVVEELYARLAPGHEPEVGAASDKPAEQVRTANSAETEELLGWKAVTSLADGLDATVAWYREHLR